MMLPTVPVTPLCIFLLIFVALHAPTFAVAAGTRPAVTLCFVVRPTLSPTLSYLVSAHTVDAHRAALPGVDWRFRAVGRGGNALVKDAVQAFAVNGSACDVVLGPGASSYAMALSPIVDVPWVDFSATSVELASAQQHPFFSRVIPSDAHLGAGMADVVAGLGWRTINVLCTNEAYGRSVTQRLAAAHAARGGTVAASGCVDTDATADEADALLGLVAASESRIVAVGGLSGSAGFRALVAAIAARGMQRTHVFLFSESACSGDDTWRALPGALCLTFRVDELAQERFLEGYARRDATAAVAGLRAVGHAGAPAAELNRQTVFTAFAHDAALLAMRAVHAAVAEGGAAAVGERAALRDRIRATSLPAGDGMTGRVAMDAVGERASMDLLVLNVDAAGAERRVAVVRDRQVRGKRTEVPYVPPDNYSYPTNRTTTVTFALGNPTVFWFSRYTSDQPPSDVDVDEEFRLTLPLAVAAAAAVVLALVLGLVACAARHNREALQRLLSIGIVGHALGAAAGLAVVAVKLVLACALYIDGAPVGYIVGYTFFVLVGVAAMLVDVVTRLQFILAMLRKTNDALAASAEEPGMAEQPVDFDKEVAWQARIKAAAVLNAVTSDAPTAIVTAIVIADGGVSDRLSLLLAATLLAAAMFGMKIGEAPGFLEDLVACDAAAAAGLDDSLRDSHDADENDGAKPHVAGGDDSSEELRAVHSGNAAAIERQKEHTAFTDVFDLRRPTSLGLPSSEGTNTTSRRPPAPSNSSRGISAEPTPGRVRSFGPFSPAGRHGGPTTTTTTGGGTADSGPASRVASMGNIQSPQENPLARPYVPPGSGTAGGTASPQNQSFALYGAGSGVPPLPPAAATHTSEADIGAISFANHLNGFDALPRPNGAGTTDGGSSRGAGSPRHLRLSAFDEFRLQRAGRKAAHQLQHDKVRKEELLDYVFPELIKCFRISRRTVAGSRIGRAIAALVNEFEYREHHVPVIDSTRDTPHARASYGLPAVPDRAEPAVACHDDDVGGAAYGRTHDS